MKETIPCRATHLHRPLLLICLAFCGTLIAFGQAGAPQQAQAPATPTTDLQQSVAPAWQTAAGGKLSFDVASVRQDKSNITPSMNVPPTPGDSFTPTGGLYTAKNVVLAEFVGFAFKLTKKELISFESQVPWSMEDLFDIEARAQGNPSKDQYRLMMQSLLAERFKLVAHFEVREMPVYALVLAKPGKFGPQLRLHSADDPVCVPNPATPLPKAVNRQFAADANGFPLSVCGGTVGMVPSAPGRSRGGGRDVSMTLIAANMAGNFDRPVIDETGIKGNVDYSVESERAAHGAPDTDLNPDMPAPTFEEALKEQLGLRLVPQKGPVEFFVVDHIEHPSPN